MNCRHCSSQLELSFVDLGSAPPSNAYMTVDQLTTFEKWFPLRVLVCQSCWLVQTEDFAAAEELFDSEYAYFSGFSSSWVTHCERYVDDMTERFSLGNKHHFIEVASNDGTLLQFAAKKGMQATGIEPTHATAQAARTRGLTVVEEFLGEETGSAIRGQYGPADLIAANNVLAHVPDINSFTSGIAALLGSGGVVTFEFPHIVNLVAHNQFDTIYHEHFSYLSLLAVSNILEAAGLHVFDVQELPTHGGSLRVFAQHATTGKQVVAGAVGDMLAREDSAGVTTAIYYSTFQSKVEHVKNQALRFLLDAADRGERVVGYGAAAKGNTLLNYAGVRRDLLSYVVDLNPAKQGKWMPGSRIPIVSDSALTEQAPDYVVILPWNLRDEVVNQLGAVRDSGAKFVTFIPELQVW